MLDKTNKYYCNAKIYFYEIQTIYIPATSFTIIKINITNMYMMLIYNIYLKNVFGFNEFVKSLI